MSVSATERAREDGRERSVPPGAFRADVEGLRAVAIGLVLLFHGGLAAVPGGFVGVDPAAGVVLAAAAAVAYTAAPRAHWNGIGGDIVASALYVINWRIKDHLLNGQLDDPQLTPVSHFWSLAIEEQFYLVWPLMMIIAALCARLVRTVPGRIVWLALAVVAVGSFAWSVRNTAHSPGTAYFSTITRMWELAIGGGVALAAGTLTRLSQAVALVLGWAGLGAVLASGLLFSASTLWPGYLAAVPTVGTAAIIAAGFTAPRGGPAHMLALAPMRWFGRLSYSIYLWHWVVLYLAAITYGGLPLHVSGAAIAATVALAWLTYTLVENPVRRSAAINRSPGLALGVGLCFTLLGVAAGALVTLADRAS